MSSSAATARVAASSAARRSARPWTSARDQAASTTTSRPRTIGATASSGPSRNRRASVVCPSCEPSWYRASPRALVLGRDRGERAGPHGERRQRRRADLEDGAAGTGDGEHALDLDAQRRSSRSGDGIRPASAREPPAWRRAGTGRAGRKRVGQSGTSAAAYQPLPGAGRRSRAVWAKGPLAVTAPARTPCARSVHPPAAGVPVPVEPTVPTTPAVPGRVRAGRRPHRHPRSAVAASCESPVP